MSNLAGSQSSVGRPGKELHSGRGETDVDRESGQRSDADPTQGEHRPGHAVPGDVCAGLCRDARGRHAGPDRDRPSSVDPGGGHAVDRAGAGYGRGRADPDRADDQAEQADRPDRRARPVRRGEPGPGVDGRVRPVHRRADSRRSGAGAVHRGGDCCRGLPCPGRAHGSSHVGGHLRLRGLLRRGRAAGHAGRPGDRLAGLVRRCRRTGRDRARGHAGRGSLGPRHGRRRRAAGAARVRPAGARRPRSGCLGVRRLRLRSTPTWCRSCRASPGSPVVW